MRASHHPINVAVLDDYQGVALSIVDWSKVSNRANINVFHDHLADQDATLLLPSAATESSQRAN